MAAQTTPLGGMILLEPGNRILLDTVRDKMTRFAEEKKGDVMDMRLCDFDDAQYRVLVEKDSANILKVFLTLPVYPEISGFGAEDALKKIYGPYVAETPADYHVALHVKMDEVTETPEEVATKISLLKSNLVGSVFDRVLSDVLSGSAPSTPFKFNLRSDTGVYVLPSADRITVVFSIDYREKSDRAIARIFLQEFVDSRRHLSAAPPCTFSHNPPLEMKHFGITEAISDQHLGFFSFAILKSHIDGGKKDRVVSNLQSFRNYIQYHIKCSKAFFHSRMRARVVSLLKVLNRAKQEPEEVAKKKFGGKAFTRK